MTPPAITFNDVVAAIGGTLLLILILKIVGKKKPKAAA